MLKRIVVLAVAMTVTMALPPGGASISAAAAEEVLLAQGPPGPGPGPAPVPGPRVLGPILGAPPAPAPYEPPPPRPRPVYTDECVTQYGWCQLPRPLQLGTACRCFREDGGSDAGRAEVR